MNNSIYGKIHAIANALQVNINHPLPELLDDILEVVKPLSEGEMVLADAYKADLLAVSLYYRRRVRYIQKLADNTKKDAGHLLNQVWRNCDEILRDQERSVRLYTTFAEETEGVAEEV